MRKYLCTPFLLVWQGEKGYNADERNQEVSVCSRIWCSSTIRSTTARDLKMWRKNLKKVLKALGFLRKRSEERKWALPWGAGALTGYSRSSA